MRLVMAVLALALMATVAQAQDPTYTEGDSGCAGCHPDKYNDYLDSGHPWKIYNTGGEVPAGNTWPHTPPPPLPMAFGNQLEWADVEYTIGNFFWKTRYIDRDGFIWTGDANDTTQWNIATQGFVPYHPGEIRPFNCGRCHTTGYDPEGHQNGLPGLDGTWAQDGVRCEACHGPASLHVAGFGTPLPPGGKDCSECHYRDEQFRMPWSGGFMRHHQQAEDLSHSPHAAYSCVTCHNPHKSTVYELGGSTVDCSGCHPGNDANSFYLVDGMEELECIDCHMPYMAKSAVKSNDYTGDVKGHLFSILTDLDGDGVGDPIFAIDNTYEVDGNRYWEQDMDGQSAATLDYSCLGCHETLGAPITIEAAAEYALNIHDVHPSACDGDLDGNEVVNVDDLLIVLGAWGISDAGDANGDGVTDVNDLLIVLGEWGPC